MCAHLACAFAHRTHFRENDDSDGLRGGSAAGAPERSEGVFKIRPLVGKC